MWIADGWKEYEVIDCSGGEKLERWGDYILVRPDPQVIWNTEKKDRAGIIRMPIITAAKRAAESGNSSTCQSSGRSITGI